MEGRYRCLLRWCCLLLDVWGTMTRLLIKRLFQHVFMLNINKLDLCLKKNPDLLISIHCFKTQRKIRKVIAFDKYLFCVHAQIGRPSRHGNAGFCEFNEVFLNSTGNLERIDRNTGLYVTQQRVYYTLLQISVYNQQRFVTVTQIYNPGCFRRRSHTSRASATGLYLFCGAIAELVGDLLPPSGLNFLRRELNKKLFQFFLIK